MERQGFILIADITGYTAYLSASELEHAQATLTDLLQLLVNHTRAPLVVTQLEGDAVMSYALEESSVSGQTFLETIEDTYVAFRRAVDLMVLNNTCRCEACANVKSLDLKFFIHFGAFGKQRIGGIDQLVGTDIIFIHRLLKNSVTAETGFGAYLLCTEEAIRALGLDTTTQEMVDLRENVPDFGSVTVWIKDMHPVYETRRAEQLATYGPDDVLITASTEISMAPERVWDYLNQSEFRNVLSGDDSQEILDRQSGRIGEGSTYRCHHGKMIIPQLVLDWRPFQRVLLQQRMPFPGLPTHTLIDFRLTPTDGGTKLEQTVTKPTGTRLKRSVARAMLKMRADRVRQDMTHFRDRIQEDLTAREATPEPSTPFAIEQIELAAAASLQPEVQGRP
ncbi:MAG TPA: DUF2652 domain-containing protein [Acidimicrobiia bacterium]|nr:DUF2652 domain-containing protein [Acidimicrobiia bacterium]